jgi:hypothetical protein
MAPARVVCADGRRESDPVATSTLRFAIIVALVVGGVLLIARFPETATSALPESQPSPSATETSSGGTGGGQTNDGNADTGAAQQTPTPQVEGVKLAVYNGTYETGLAADVADTLVNRFGYKIDPATSILDAESKPYDQTTLYYVAQDDKIEAEALANSFFKKLDVKIQKLPADVQVPDGARVAVYLGTDYALRQPA